MKFEAERKPLLASSHVHAYYPPRHKNDFSYLQPFPPSFSTTPFITFILPAWIP